MNINYVKSQSTVKPDLIDATSSKKYVYIRKDIVEVQHEEDENIMYEYQEAKLTKKEYEQYLEELTCVDTLEVIETLKTENMALSEQINMLTMCLIEMSELVYA